jgi:hypothetical protein
MALQQRRQNAFDEDRRAIKTGPRPDPLTDRAATAVVLPPVQSPCDALLGDWGTLFFRFAPFVSSQLPRQILCLQVRIPTQHAQILVPSDAGDLHNVQSLLEKPRGRLVAQVVKAKVFDAGVTDGAHVGALHRLGGDAWEDVTMQGTGQGA